MKDTLSETNNFDLKNAVFVKHAINTLHKCTLSIDDKSVFLACPSRVENYYALWTRDAMVSLIGALCTNDPELVQTARNSWQILQNYQTKRGRIPAYLGLENPSNPQVEFGGWGRIETLDSQLWYVIAAWQLYKHTQEAVYITDSALDSYDKALELLAYRAYKSEASNLVDWPVSSGWDDQMQRRHHVLSLECLRILAFSAISNLYLAADLHLRAELYINRLNLLREKVKNNFWLNEENISWILAPTSLHKGPGYFSAEQESAITYVKEHPLGYFTSYLAPYEITSDHLKRFDSYGNILAILAGVADKKQSESIFSHINKRNIDVPFPLRVLDPPIVNGDADFHEFFERYRNKPYKYHNGGIWPHITALYILALLKCDKNPQAQEAFGSLVDMVKQKSHYGGDWGFNEYYDGKTGKPGKDSRDYQAWSASGVLYAYTAVNKRVSIFN